ncbi:MAG TPA: hypothetical protein DCG54_11835, partial [Anaerolineae bacterium]|nr:hypothetical protein [Anaerolineae bacterium]
LAGCSAKPAQQAPQCKTINNFFNDAWLKDIQQGIAPSVAVCSVELNWFTLAQDDRPAPAVTPNARSDISLEIRLFVNIFSTCCV